MSINQSQCGADVLGLWQRWGSGSSAWRWSTWNSQVNHPRPGTLGILLLWLGELLGFVVFLTTFL